FDLVTGDVLGVFQNVWIATGRCGGSSFLQFVVSGIGKTEEEMFETLLEFWLFGQVGETFAFRLERRVQEEEAIADEDGAGHFVVNGSHETNRTGAEAEGASVALEIEVGDGDGFSAESEIAEGGIDAVRIGDRLAVHGRGEWEVEGDGEKKRGDKMKKSRARAACHESSRECAMTSAERFRFTLTQKWVRESKVADE